MAVAGYRGKVYGQTGPAVAFIEKPAAEVAGSTPAHTVYQISDATRRVWDKSAAVTVEVSTDAGATWGPATGYTVQYLGGVIVFDAARGAADEVRVSGSAYPMAPVADFTNWSGDFETELKDTTTLDGDGNRTYTAWRMNATVTAEGYNQDAYFYGKLTAGAIVVLSLYADYADGGHYDVLTYLNKLATGGDQSDPKTRKLDFQGSGDVRYNVG